jgi:prepilin-type N-terminal cleavage/methylation domain-containing protein
VSQKPNNLEKALFHEKRTSMKNISRGFTLIEILVVVVILAVLAAFTLPRMTGQVDKAKAGEALQIVGAIRRAAERRHDLTRSYSVPSGIIGGKIGEEANTNWKELGLDIKPSTNWGFEYDAYGSDPDYLDINVYDADGNRVINYMDDNGDMRWVCQSPFKRNDGKTDGQNLVGCTI